ncbi:MAG TPA: tryptophan--tRNA ligase [Bdellovibrionota bacterium]|nr:tryptophan--tRNA ligase [Bdellovibrionota bacterium]
MRIFSGMRPTGKLHLGHLFGVLNNWIDLQNKGNDCFFCIADWHALTTEFQDTKSIEPNIREMLIDWLAAGLDPKKSTIFLQSQVKEHSELYLLLGMITPLGRLERNPTYKELKQEITDRDLSNFGFLGYPVLQAADILLYKGEAVPVGQDQLPHLELTREIVRRFNNVYGKTFPEPRALLTQSPKVNGVDGRKMSKSYGNAILLSDSEEQVRAKIREMVTDPKRARRQDPGDPDTCNLYPLHEILSTQKTIGDVRKGCTTAGIGCVDCKGLLLPSLLAPLKQIRERREEIASSPKTLDRVLEEGAERAHKIAAETMKEVRKAVKLHG